MKHSYYLYLLHFNSFNQYNVEQKIKIQKSCRRNEVSPEPVEHKYTIRTEDGIMMLYICLSWKIFPIWSRKKQNIDRIGSNLYKYLDKSVRTLSFLKYSMTGCRTSLPMGKSVLYWKEFEFVYNNADETRNHSFIQQKECCLKKLSCKLFNIGPMTNRNF